MPHSAPVIYQISIPIAGGITKVVEAVAQTNGLTIRANASSVNAKDEWIIHVDNGPHIFEIRSPQPSNDSATPGAASGLEP